MPEPSTTADTATDTPADAVDCGSPEILSFHEVGRDWDGPDAEATLVHGPQGGWHIGGTARVRGAPFLDVHTEVHTTSDEQLAGDDNTFRMVLFGHDAESCEGDLVGIIAYLDDMAVDQEQICDMVGSSLIVTLTITDDEGSSYQVERQVLAVPDPTDPCG